jgi:redox-sensing transcriptional repressor
MGQDKTSSVKIPEVCISRLSVYLRILKELSLESIYTISSQELAERTGINSYQVRKDFSYFGQFGHRGVGYRVKGLIDYISEILGLDKQWRMAICGLGNLGSALFGYKGFLEQGLKIVAIFDNDPSKVGTKYGGLKIHHPKDISWLVKRKAIQIAIITTPVSAAQEVTNKFVHAGVEAVLNFAPVKLMVPQGVKLRNVDLSMELSNLTYFLRRLPKRRG